MKNEKIQQNENTPNYEKKQKSGLLRRFAQYSLFKAMSHELFLPVVNSQGDVTGKILIDDAFLPDNSLMLPMVRIAVAAYGLPYLRPRTQTFHFEPHKTDLPIEDYLHYGESLEHAAHRILRKSLPDAPAERLFFNLAHLYQRQDLLRLVYLYTLDLDDDTLLAGQGGKLWTFQQIEHNLPQNFFSTFFDEEYDTLKQIILTREQFKH